MAGDRAVRDRLKTLECSADADATPKTRPAACLVRQVNITLIIGLRLEGLQNRPVEELWTTRNAAQARQFSAANDSSGTVTATGRCSG